MFTEVKILAADFKVADPQTVYQISNLNLQAPLLFNRAC